MNKEKILLIGAGGHSQSCIDVIEQENKYEIAGLIGIKEEVGQNRLGYEVIGIVLIGKDESTYITEKSIWDENVENYKNVYNFHLITTDGLFYIFDKQKIKKVIDYSDTEYINVKNYPI